MHPQIALRIADERAKEMTEAAATARLARLNCHLRAGSHAPPQSCEAAADPKPLALRARKRAGWALVTLGLRLALGAERPLRP